MDYSIVGRRIVGHHCFHVAIVDGDLVLGLFVSYVLLHFSLGVIVHTKTSLTCTVRSRGASIRLDPYAWPTRSSGERGFTP
jgi:hypothetical protein